MIQMLSNGSIQYKRRLGSHILATVGAVAGGVGCLVGDMVLPCLGLDGLLSWVTSMVVVGGVVAAVGTSLGW